MCGRGVAVGVVVATFASLRVLGAHSHQRRTSQTAHTPQCHTLGLASVAVRTLPRVHDGEPRATTGGMLLVVDLVMGRRAPS